MPTNLTDRIIWMLCIIAFEIRKFFVQTQMRLQAKSRLLEILFVIPTSFAIGIYFIGVLLIFNFNMYVSLTAFNWTSFVISIGLCLILSISTLVAFLVTNGGIHGISGIMDRFKKDVSSLKEKFEEYSKIRELLELNDVAALGFDTTLCFVIPFSAANSSIEEMTAFDNLSSCNSLKSLYSKLSELKRNTEISLDECERNLRMIREKLNRMDRVSNALRDLYTIHFIQSTCTPSQFRRNRIDDELISSLITILLGYLEDGGTMPSWRFKEDSGYAPENIFDAIDKRMRHAQIMLMRSNSSSQSLTGKNQTLFEPVPYDVMEWKAF